MPPSTSPRPTRATSQRSPSTSTAGLAWLGLPPINLVQVSNELYCATDVPRVEFEDKMLNCFCLLAVGKATVKLSCRLSSGSARQLESVRATGLLAPHGEVDPKSSLLAPRSSLLAPRSRRHSVDVQVSSSVSTVSCPRRRHATPSLCPVGARDHRRRHCPNGSGVPVPSVRRSDNFTESAPPPVRVRYVPVH